LKKRYSKFVKCIRKLLYICAKSIIKTLKIIIMLPIFAYGIAAVAGVGVSEILEKIFVQRQSPQQAVQGINWIRLAIAGILVAVVIIFINKKIKK